MSAICRKAAYLLFLIALSCQAQQSADFEHLSLQDAEAKYLNLLFSKGVPELGIFRADEEIPGYW